MKIAFLIDINFIRKGIEMPSKTKSPKQSAATSSEDGKCDLNFLLFLTEELNDLKLTV